MQAVSCLQACVKLCVTVHTPFIVCDLEGCACRLAVESPPDRHNVPYCQAITTLLLAQFEINLAFAHHTANHFHGVYEELNTLLDTIMHNIVTKSSYNVVVKTQFIIVHLNEEKDVAFALQ